MTNERIAELDRMASNAIRECRIQGQPDNPALGFWKGVKMVVDELKRERASRQDGGKSKPTFVDRRSSLITYTSVIADASERAIEKGVKR